MANALWFNNVNENCKRNGPQSNIGALIILIGITTMAQPEHDKEAEQDEDEENRFQMVIEWICVLAG